jgi:hypothetical protein
VSDKHSPSHYQGFSNGAQVIDIAERLNFNRGNVVKYVARAGRKHGESAIDDLKKARVYLDREIERIETDGIEVKPALAQAISRIREAVAASGALTGTGNNTGTETGSDAE